MITKAQWRLWAKQDMIEWQIIMDELINSFRGLPPSDLMEAWREIDEANQKRYAEYSMTPQELDLQKIKDAYKLMGEQFSSLDDEGKDKWLARYEELCNTYFSKYGEYEYQTRERLGEVVTADIAQPEPVSNGDSPQQSALF